MAKQSKTNSPKTISKQSSPTLIPSSNSGQSNDWLYILGILVFTFIIFIQCKNFDFVNWDDDRNVYENPLINNLSWKNIKAIFTSDIIGNYNPLPILSFAIEKHYFGMSPKTMHITNILLHLLCTFFVFKIFKRLGLTVFVACIGTLLFAIHPLKVESVAWITERKDVLFGCFFLAATLMYIKNGESYSKKRSLWIFLLFFIGLFAKIQMVTLPLTFLAIDYWRDRELSMKLILEKWYFWIGSIACGLVNIHFLKQQGSLESNTDFNIIERLFIGSFSLVVYLIKFLIPYKMLPLYAYNPELDWKHYASMPLVLALFYVMYRLYKSNHKAIVFGFAFFFFNIMFLLQVLGAGQGYLADRFTYIAYIGLCFIVCYYIQLSIEQQKIGSNLIYSCSGLVILIFAFISYRQCQYWKNSGVLWSRVLEFQNNTSLPYNNRANYYRDLNLTDQALKDYNRAIELKAGHATYNSRAKLFFNRNEDQKALMDYSKAISLAPNQAEYYVNRGAAHAKLGNPTAAIEDFNKGLSMDPTWKVGYLNRSIMYNQTGDLAHALQDIDSYLKLDPTNADIWYEGARCQRALNNPNKAIEYYNNAIRINPKVGLFYAERGKTYQQLGNTNAANADINKARSLGENVSF